MSKSAVVITPELEMSVIDISDNDLVLKQLQSAVDGYIEAVPLGDVMMWVNEEFIFRQDLLPNLLASALFSEVGGTRPIFGTVVLTGGTDPEGYSLGLTTQEVSEVERLVCEARALFD